MNTSEAENGELRSSETYYKKIGRIIRHNLNAAGIDESEAADIVGCTQFGLKGLSDDARAILFKPVS